MFQFRVWSRPESINQTDLALETGVETLAYYEELFGEPFPLPKQGNTNENVDWQKSPYIAIKIDNYIVL